MNKILNKSTVYFVISFILSTLLMACGSGDQSTGSQNKAGKSQFKSKRSQKTVPVEVSKAKMGLAASYYVTTATIEPSSDAKINSRTSGVVKQILHEEGDDVKNGQILLILDDDDQSLRLKQAQQKLASASREFKRLNKMKKAGVVSSTEWETTENNFITAQTDKKLAELALSYTRVAAPFDGRVVWREVDLGEHVGQGELLFRMMSIRPLLVRVHIPANRLGMVATGQTVQLIIDSVTETLNATIQLISPIVDPTTGTIKITLRLDQYPQNVRPGDFTEIHMVTDKHENALLLPSVSIIEERGQHFIYIVKGGIAKRQSVVIGFVMGDKTEIISGINNLDLVVVKGQRTLNDDVAVEILSASEQINLASAKDTATQSKPKNSGNKDKKNRGQQ